MKIKNLELYYVTRIIQPIDIEETETYCAEGSIEIGPIILVKDDTGYKNAKTNALYMESSNIGISRISKDPIEPLSNYYYTNGDKKRDDLLAEIVYDEVEELVKDGYIKTHTFFSNRNSFWKNIVGKK